MSHVHEGLPGLHTHTHGGHTHTHIGVSITVPDGPAPRLHLQGVVLPDGEATDLWICDGVIRTEPVAGALTVATGVWILPGLVDAHCHIGMPSDEQWPPPLDRDEVENQAITDRDAGTLLVRDCGSPTDTRWIDERDDLPTVIRAGRHIAQPRRYMRDVADEVGHGDLVAAVERQVEAGDGWIKLVGDWIDRATGDLAPLWDADVARAAIAEAHELGAKVTAHCFAEESVATLVEAGIDGIEHGTGITDDVIDAMAERQVALVPTLINIDNFEQFAASGEEKFPVYAAHMRALHATNRDVFRHAVEAGVPVFAGTDAGGTVPHGLIGAEIEALGQIGDAEFALGAASWRAREWLGMPGLTEGASADLVVYRHDPRRDLGAVRHPALVILRGKIVTVGAH